MNIKRRLAAAVLFAMILPLLQPAATVYAAPKNFTYAEQNTGVSVQSLHLEPGEKVDLKFLGISDYKKHKLTWTSSNEKVATVTSAGVITAKAAGNTTIKLTVGDGTAYASQGVNVTVGKREDVALGTSSTNTFASLELSLGKTIDLGFYGVKGWNSSRYKCSWVSTNPTVAVVDQKGVVIPIKEGTTFIILLITDKFTSTSLSVTPVTLTVVGKEIPTPSPSPKLTVTPTPTPASVSYTVSVPSMDEIKLTFSKAVNYTKDDFSLYYLNGSSETKQDFVLSWNSSKTEATLETSYNLSDGDRYRVRVGAKDTGTLVDVSLGIPNRLVITYECMGKEGAAYAAPSNGMDLPITLKYRLYYNNIDVTDEYDRYGDVEFELVSSSDSTYVLLNDDELHFYEAGEKAVVRAVFEGTKGGKEFKVSSQNTSITAKSISSYSVRLDKWTIVESGDNSRIDWSNPVHSVTEGSYNAQLVLLLTDSFGNQYSTDDRGVNESEKIYALDNSDLFFEGAGYSISFSSDEEEDGSVDTEGSLSVYSGAKKVSVSVTLSNNYDYDFRDRRVGTLSVQVKAAPKLSSIKPEQTSVTLVKDCLAGFEERFCSTEIKINAFDQYGDAWDESISLSVTSNNAAINNAIGGTGSLAYISGDNTLVIDVSKLPAEAASLNSFTLYVTENEIEKRVSVSVKLSTPFYDSEDKDEIVVNSSKLVAENVTIEFTGNDYVISSRIELQKLSRTVAVGLYDQIHYVTKTSDIPDIKDCGSGDIGDVYIMITGPDNKAVPEVTTPDAAGVYVDNSQGCIFVNVTGADGKKVEFLDAGKYRVKLVVIEEDDGEPKKANKETYFTVTDKTEAVTFRDIKDNKTEAYVSSEDDISGIGDIIEELFVFTMNGKTFPVYSSMVEDAYFTWKEKYVAIKRLTISVPIGDSGYSYTQTIRNIGKMIYYGVDD